jgi:hypothetical protein
VAYDDKDEPVFCADAMADPLTGVLAAIAARLSLQSGGGALLELSMSGVAAFFAAPGDHALRDYAVARSPDGWGLQHGDLSVDIAPPHALPTTPPARALGVDTQRFGAAP